MTCELLVYHKSDGAIAFAKQQRNHGNGKPSKILISETIMEETSSSYVSFNFLASTIFSDFAVVDVTTFDRLRLMTWRCSSRVVESSGL
jgi:hypothetical protein